MSDAVRSITQVEGNQCLREFFVRNSNQPVERHILVEELKEKLQANDNQATGLIQRSYNPPNKNGEVVLIKNGKEYSLNTTLLQNSTSIIEDVKGQISNFHQELSKNISVDKVESVDDFNQLKNLLEQLKELTK